MQFLRPLQLAYRLLFPRCCCICGERLQEGEPCICSGCFLNLPLTNLKGARGNVLERIFWKRLPIVRATAYMRYLHKNPLRRPILAFKYYDRPELAVFFGSVMAHDVVDDFFEGIDAIIPIPLSKERQHWRGYNQSEKLAEGIAKVAGLPIWNNCIMRKANAQSQTRLSDIERQMNVMEVFDILTPEQLREKHLLLVDDVFTTGATLYACAKQLSEIDGVRISFMTLALARRIRLLHLLKRRQSLIE